jgi:hypothetical protein
VGKNGKVKKNPKSKDMFRRLTMVANEQTKKNTMVSSFRNSVTHHWIVGLTFFILVCVACDGNHFGAFRNH